MLKTTAPPILTRPAYTKINENKLDSDGGGRINDKIVNLSSSTKKISSRAGFFTPKPSLAFT